jgi:WD40 repeat protein
VATRTRYQLPAGQLTDGIAAFAFSPDSATLTVGAPDGGVSLWDVATRTVRAALTDHAEDRYAAAEEFPDPGVQALAFGDHGKLLAVATTSNWVALWDVAGGRLLARLGEARSQEPGERKAAGDLGQQRQHHGVGRRRVIGRAVITQHIAVDNGDFAKTFFLINP